MLRLPFSGNGQSVRTMRTKVVSHHYGLFKVARSGFYWRSVRREGRRSGGLRFQFHGGWKDAAETYY